MINFCNPKTLWAESLKKGSGTNLREFIKLLQQFRPLCDGAKETPLEGQMLWSCGQSLLSEHPEKRGVMWEMRCGMWSVGCVLCGVWGMGCRLWGIAITFAVCLALSRSQCLPLSFTSRGAKNFANMKLFLNTQWQKLIQNQRQNQLKAFGSTSSYCIAGLQCGLGSEPSTCGLCTALYTACHHTTECQ